MKLFIVILIAFTLFLNSCQQSTDPSINTTAENSELSLAKKSNGKIGINIILNTEVTDQILTDLGQYGRVLDVIKQIHAVRIFAKAEQIDVLLNLDYVSAVNPDAEREGSPVDMVAAQDFSEGLSTWNLDAINVTTGPWFNTRVEGIPDGIGVYMGILDTGLLDSWRKYFPEERIAVEYAKSFGGGGVAGIHVSEQPNKWEHDQYSHGTHVTSTVLGYSFRGTPVNGVSPMVKVIPVKVLNQNGRGWSSVITHGILYMAELKAGPLKDYPVVVNMSLGGSYLDAWEKAAIDYAIDKGVIIVASAGNRGLAGMGYPGAYEPVISVAAYGWEEEWSTGPWWYALDVAEPTNHANNFYITAFSSRALPGQDLDVSAPGSWVVGPYQLQSGKTSYYYLGGTSMASPHVAGIVALMLEKNPTLTAFNAEEILEDTAIDMPAYETEDTGSGMVDATAATNAIP